MPCGITARSLVALVPNVRILNFILGAPAPTNQPVSKFGTGVYRSVEQHITVYLRRGRDGIIASVEVRSAGRLRLDGRPLSAGYRVFRPIPTREGWKPFHCGRVEKGMALTDRQHPKTFVPGTFVRWSNDGALASISLPSAPPLFGLCDDYSGAPSGRPQPTASQA